MYRIINITSYRSLQGIAPTSSFLFLQNCRNTSIQKTTWITQSLCGLEFLEDSNPQRLHSHQDLLRMSTPLKHTCHRDSLIASRTLILASIQVWKKSQLTRSIVSRKKTGLAACFCEHLSKVRLRPAGLQRWKWRNDQCVVSSNCYHGT